MRPSHLPRTKRPDTQPVTAGCLRLGKMAIAHVAAACLCPVLWAQTQLINATLHGSAILINPGQTYTHIYVVFPPSSGTNHDDLVEYVMPQSAIDGVNVQINWNNIETSAPSQMDCTQLTPPLNNPDECQPDPLVPGWFHTYSWSAVDGSGCADYSGTISQWFCDFPWGSNNFKRVAIQLFGIGPGPSNPVTPPYVTQSAWINAAAPSSYQYQDVVNTVNAYTGTNGCGGYSGSYSIPPGTTFSGDTSIPPNVTVTGLSSAPTFSTKDTIWLNPQFTPASHPAFDITTPHGATVSNVVTTSPYSFTYKGSGSSGDNHTATSTGTAVALVTAVQSWPVPYEAPYEAAWLSFLRAAIYHFNHLNNTGTSTHCVGTSGPSCTLNETTAQIAYLRAGVAEGGEAYPICTSSSLTSTPMNSTMPSFTEPHWDGWYGTVNDTIQAAGPQMQIMFSINAGDPDPSTSNATFAANEASRAVAHYNSVGQFNGFGSQGLQWADQTNINGSGTGLQISGCPYSGTAPDTGNNWGCMFNKYWDGSNSTLYNPTGGDPPAPTTVPLELQQIDCSNPCTANPPFTCSQGGIGDTCMQGGSPGKTEDLRGLYPFATQNYASIIELYSQDALLAFDPNFCTLSLGSCSGSGVTFSGLTLGTQHDFFQYVGIGNGQSLSGTCYVTYGYTSGQIQGSASGDCSYAAAIYAAHGYH